MKQKYTEKEIALYRRGLEEGFEMGWNEGMIALLDDQAERAANVRAYIKKRDPEAGKIQAQLAAEEQAEEMAALRRVFSEGLFLERLHPRES